MKLNLKIKQLNPDRSNYKRNGIVYEPDNLYVQVDVPDEYLSTEKCLVESDMLTEEGLKYLVGRLADLVDDIEDAHIEKIKKG